MQPDQAKDLVAKILDDPAAYDSLKAQLEAQPSERLEALLKAIDASNPPVLATGGTD